MPGGGVTMYIVSPAFLPLLTYSVSLLMTILSSSNVTLPLSLGGETEHGGVECHRTASAVTEGECGSAPAIRPEANESPESPDSVGRLRGAMTN